MLVHELIEALNAMPPDWSIVYDDYTMGPQDVTVAALVVERHSIYPPQSVVLS